MLCALCKWPGDSHDSFDSTCNWLLCFLRSSLRRTGWLRFRRLGQLHTRGRRDTSCRRRSNGAPVQYGNHDPVQSRACRTGHGDRCSEGPGRIPGDPSTAGVSTGNLQLPRRLRCHLPAHLPSRKRQQPDGDREPERLLGGEHPRHMRAIRGPPLLEPARTGPRHTRS